MELSSISNLAIYRVRRLVAAKDRWRDAAGVVSARWDAFLQSEAESRAFAFSSYIAALDAEEAAAADVSRLLSSNPGDRAAA
jgi:hypothetical protein